MLALEPAFLQQRKFDSPGVPKAASVLRTKVSLVGYRNPKKGKQTPRARNAAPAKHLLSLEPAFLQQHTFGTPGAAKAASVLRTNAFLIGYRNPLKGRQTPRAPNATAATAAQRLLALEPTFLHQHRFDSPGAATPRAPNAAPA